MRTSNLSERFGLRALVLASAIVSASACAPAPMDAGNGTTKGGSSGSGSGGSGGTTPSGSGGSATSGSGGSAPSGSGGSATSGSGGSGQTASGGTTGSGGTTTGTGGTTMMGTGGTTMPRPDAGAMETGGGADMGAAAPTFTVAYAMVISPMCAMCHNMGAAANHKGVVLATKATALTTMKAVAGTIVPGNAAMSNLVKLMQNMGANTAKRMPPAGTLPTPAQIKVVSDWINGGALDN